jgi:hypothetical protein
LLLRGKGGDQREELPLGFLPQGECTSSSCCQRGRVSRSQRVIAMKMSANTQRCLVHWLLSLGYVDDKQNRSKRAKIFTCQQAYGNMDGNLCGNPALGRLFPKPASSESFTPSSLLTPHRTTSRCGNGHKERSTFTSTVD